MDHTAWPPKHHVFLPPLFHFQITVGVFFSKYSSLAKFKSKVSKFHFAVKLLADPLEF